jgi:hypothetical protein
MAIIIDTSLAYTGFQLAYRLAWKPAVAMQAGPAAISAAPRVTR